MEPLNLRPSVNRAHLIAPVSNEFLNLKDP